MKKNTWENCLILVGRELKAYNNKEGDDKVSVDSYKKYFLLRVEIKNYNIEIDGKNFYDQPINDSIKQYGKIRKYQQDAVDLSKQKALDADSRAIQQIIFTGKIKATEQNTRVIIYYIFEKSKETIKQFSKGTAKFL